MQALKLCQVMIKHLKEKMSSLDTYHNKREDQADEEEAQPVYRPSDHVSCRARGLCEQLGGQNVRHTTFTGEETAQYIC